MAFLNDFIFLAGLLIIVSILAGLLSSRVGAPLLLVFLGLGTLVGEDGVIGVRFDNFELAYVVATLCLAIILFDGGLRTPMTSVRVAWAPATVLATLGVVVTSAITGVAAVMVLDLDWLPGLLVGAIVGSTDAAAVFLLLHQKGMELRKRLSATLEIESGANDPMAIFLTITLVELIAQSAAGLSWQSGQLFLTQMGLGAICGLAGGFLLSLVVNRIDLAGGLYPVFALAAGLTVFAGAQLVDGSGFLAVYLAGIVVGNRRMRANQLIRRFHDGMAWFAQIVMFLILGLLVTPSRLVPEAVPAIVIALVLIFIARPVAVFLCLLPFRSLSREERLFIAWVGLRGAVPLFLAMIPVLGGVENSYTYFNVVFIVVIASLVLQGWTIPWVARRLGLELPPAPEPASRLEFDLLPEADRDFIAYKLAEGSPAATKPFAQISLPPRVRVIAVLRQGAVQSWDTLERLLPEDHVLVLSPPDQVGRLDRLFMPPSQLRRALRPSALGLFAFPGDTPTGAVAATYDLPVTSAERALPIADYLRGRLGKKPETGDRLRLGAVDLVVREMDESAITSVGVVLEPEPLALVPQRLRRIAERLREKAVALLRRAGRRGT
ncbi:MAG: potassium/proton antiporter [Bacteroidota bacterium]|nr:potassium/proton antiporter [Kiloniellaceae bacterium]